MIAVPYNYKLCCRIFELNLTNDTWNPMMMPKVFSWKHSFFLFFDPAFSFVSGGQEAYYGALDYGKFERTDAAGKGPGNFFFHKKR